MSLIPARRKKINAALSDASIHLQAAFAQSIEICDLPLAASLKDLAGELHIALSRNQHADDTGRSEVTS